MAKKTQEQRIEEAAASVTARGGKLLEEAEAALEASQAAEGETVFVRNTETGQLDPIATIPDAPSVERMAAAIDAALQSDDVDAWNRVAEMLYELERNKHNLPGLHQSILGGLLARLP